MQKKDRRPEAAERETKMQRLQTVVSMFISFSVMIIAGLVLLVSSLASQGRFLE